MKLIINQYSINLSNFSNILKQFKKESVHHYDGLNTKRNARGFPEDLAAR